MSETTEAPPTVPVAFDALELIRNALDDEIDITVNPELTDAFKTVKAAIVTQLAQENTPDPAPTEAQAPPPGPEITDERTQIATALNNLALRFAQLGDGFVGDQVVNVAGVLDLIAQDFQHIAAVLRSGLVKIGTGYKQFVWEDNAEPLTEGEINEQVYGEKIGINDRVGKPLRVGDKVRYFNSNRFGDGEATVVGVGDNDDPDASPGRRRPKLKIDPDDTEYEPSAERVERIGNEPRSPTARPSPSSR